MGFLLELLIDLLLGFAEKLDDRLTYPSETTERTKIVILVAAVFLMFVYAAYLAIHGWLAGDTRDLILGCLFFVVLLIAAIVIAWRHR
ncbi:MAG: hypothetical protein IJX04_11930 [Oscillospiraceae bacterium]|nr:hypothetical protein [Oscillospiraceae bacterium]